MYETWPDLYLRHFTRYFGKPFDVVVYRHEFEDPLRLAVFDRAYPKYRVYASLGLSLHDRDLKGMGEIILLADDAGQDVPTIFVNALFFMLTRKIAINSRFAIGGVDMVNEPFATYFDKSAIYVAPAHGFPEGFETVCGDDGDGSVYQGIFISASEQDYLNRHGAAALEEKLFGHDADPCSLRRGSCV